MLGHAVERLCQAAAASDPDFAARRARWAILDGRDVPTRYPNTLPDSIPARVYTAPAARQAVALAAAVVGFVAGRLGLTS